MASLTINISGALEYSESFQYSKTVQLPGVTTFVQLEERLYEESAKARKELVEQIDVLRAARDAKKAPDATTF